MIELKNLTKKFGNFTAVDNLNLKIAPGEFFGFLGPNGAGKTTTIKMLTGLYAPTAGNIFIHGIDIQKDPVNAKMKIGYIPDEPFLYDKLTGLEYLYFSGGLYRLDKKILKDRIDKLIETFKLNEWINRLTEEYSRGMKQRIAIASALIHNPSVIVIDEPIVGLDPESALIVKKTLKELSINGTSIFMSTHLLSIAEELCDRIAIIKSGKIIFEIDKDFLLNLKTRKDGKLEELFLKLTKTEEIHPQPE